MSEEQNITLENGNDEIVYSLDHRRPIHVFLGGICPAALALFLGVAILRSQGLTVFWICAGILFLLIGFFVLLQTISFIELIIYKDRVVVNKHFFGKSTIKIKDIKKIHFDGHLAATVTSIIGIDGKSFSQLRFDVMCLIEEQVFEIRKVIANLQKEQGINQ